MKFWNYLGYGVAGAVLGGVIGVMIGSFGFSLGVKMPPDISVANYREGIATELAGLLIGGLVGAVISIRVRSHSDPVVITVPNSGKHSNILV